MRRRPFLISASLSSLWGIITAGDSRFVVSAGAVSAGPEALRPSDQINVCGPNALYIFLKLNRHAVAPETFFAAVKPGERGLSLAELREASERFGLTVAIRHCTYEQLASGCQLPVIALLHREGEAGNHAIIGHYVVVLGADTEGVVFIDGTSGEQERWTGEAFCRLWNGYVLVAAQSQASWWSLSASVVASLSIIWFVTVQIINRVRTKRPK